MLGEVCSEAACETAAGAQCPRPEGGSLESAGEYGTKGGCDYGGAGGEKKDMKQQSHQRSEVT